MGLWEPEIELELDEGEQIIDISRHHWLLLARNLAIPLAIALVTGGIAISRAIGFGVLVLDPDLRGVLDWVNIALLVIGFALLMLWAWGGDLRAKPKTKPPVSLTWLIVGALVLVGALFLYRYNGGRLLALDPSLAAPFDLFNTVLFTIAAVAVLACLYVLIDWRNDALILTNTRIILDKDELLIRHIQQQILLVDVQQVFMRQNTYPQSIFRYGSITVQSFSLRKLLFDFATSPQRMETLLKQQISNTRKAVEPNLVRRLVEERVFENKPRPSDIKPVGIQTRGGDRQGVLAWLFPANPQVDAASGQITWRPSGVYVGLIMLRPFILWVVASGVALFVGISSPDALWWVALIWFVVSLVCAGWIFWLREEYVNDVYILGRREIIDVDRRPFGPINRRSAPIGNVQNVFFDISFYEQILGYGTVKIQTGGTGDFSFSHVPDPRGVQAMINDYLTDFKRGAEERNLQNSIDVFKEYHALQRDRGELIDRAMLDTTIDSRARTIVDDYANNTAPIQIEYHLRRSAVRAALLRRRARLRRVISRRRNQNP